MLARYWLGRLWIPTSQHMPFLNSMTNVHLSLAMLHAPGKTYTFLCCSARSREKKALLFCRSRRELPPLNLRQQNKSGSIQARTVSLRVVCGVFNAYKPLIVYFAQLRISAAQSETRCRANWMVWAVWSKRKHRLLVILNRRWKTRTGEI